MALDLIAEMRRCQHDTERFLGQGAATRLAHWQQFADNPTELIAYVQRVLRGPHRANGFELDRKGGRSLEQIVIEFGSPTFTNEDIGIARETLGK